jgi:hypothetical protein
MKLLQEEFFNPEEPQIVKEDFKSYDLMKNVEN